MPTIKILPKGSPIPAKAFQLKRPEYKKMLPFWEFYRHSHELTGGYEANVQTYKSSSEGDDQYSFDETYLVPHEKESALDFSRRVANATPPRFIQEGISYITGVLTQQPPNRDGYPDEINEWSTRVTAQGQTLHQWIAADVVPMVERYGHVYTLHTRPDIGGDSAAEQTAAREAAGLPEVVCSVILPENLPWWETDDSGRLVAVRYTEVKSVQVDEGGLPVDEKEATLHWWITLEGWMSAVETNETAIVDGALAKNGAVLDSGTWNTDGSLMDNLPVVKVELNGPGPTEAAALSMLKYFRVESVLTNLEYSTGFPMTWVPVESEDANPAETVKGENIVGGFPADGAHVPMILEPEGTSIGHLVTERLPALETDSLTPYGRNREVGNNDSGVALAHISEGAAKVHTDHALAFSGGEFDMMQPVAELLNVELKDESRVKWPNDFKALDDVKETEIATAFKEMMPGSYFEEKIIAAQARRTLPDLLDPDYEEGLEVWRTEKEEEKAAESEMADIEKDVLAMELQQPAALNPQQVGGGKNKPTATPEPVG